MKTLVVDQSTSARNLLCIQIGRLGIETVAADSGSTALKIFLGEKPDLVLLNANLSDIDGFSVARRIRALEAPGDWTPILLLTPPKGEDELARGLAAGGDDYLFIPISEAVLSAKIRAMQRQIQMRYSMLAVTRKLDLANQELRRLTAVDGLTGIANRRHFDATLTREWRRSMRQGSELSLIMADVDHFKKYNDHYGHQAGDDCLRRIAAILETAVERGGDIAARYGGEEFALILPDTGLAGAMRLAEQIRASVWREHIRHDAAPLERITMSLGIASAVAMPETDEKSLLQAADEALYRSKASGRNCATAAVPPEVGEPLDG